MKNQREALLEILASNVPFKGEIVLQFDTTLDSRDFEALEYPEQKVGKNDSLADDYELLSRQFDEVNQELDTAHALLAKTRNERDLMKIDNLELKNKIKKLQETVLVKQQAAEPRYKKRGKYNPKLSREQVWDVRDYIQIGKKNAEIVKLMGNKFSASVVDRIRKGTAYRRVTDRPHPSAQTNSKPTTVHAGHGVVSQQ